MDGVRGEGRYLDASACVHAGQKHLQRRVVLPLQLRNQPCHGVPKRLAYSSVMNMCVCVYVLTAGKGEGGKLREKIETLATCTSFHFVSVPNNPNTPPSPHARSLTLRRSARALRAVTVTGLRAPKRRNRAAWQDSNSDAHHSRRRMAL